MTFQVDIGRLGCWARKWGMEFPPVKCNIRQVSSKRIKKINASYNLEGTVLDNVENIRYLGVTIKGTHVSNIYTKANRTLGFLRRNLSACPQDVPSKIFKSSSVISFNLLVIFASIFFISSSNCFSSSYCFFSYMNYTLSFLP